MTIRRLTPIALTLVLLGAICPVPAAEPGKAKAELTVVPLWTEKVPGAVGEEDRDRPTLTIHLPAAAKATGTGMIACPGGGYTIHVVDHEGQQVARWLNSVGIAAFMFALSVADGPCLGPHRIVVRQLATDVLTTPTLEDLVVFTRLNKEARGGMRCEVKPSENKLDLDLRTK